MDDGAGGSPGPPPAWQPSPPEDLVVATPERVSFSYETANLGSRFVAQVVDLAALLGMLIGLGGIAAAVGSMTHDSTVPILLLLVGGFAIFWGYFIVSEAVWSGLTLGKRALRLRAVDLRGGPLSVSQALIRNLVRIVDFLPSYYVVGAIAIFVTQRNQRLGDLAAGTVVVHERQAVSLRDLGSDPPTATPAGPPRWGRRLEPQLLRFVVAYAGRRQQLEPARRAELAAQVEPALRAVLPDLVARGGPLAALDQLADEESAR
ncbi:MAG: RDD family protein [Candidatus Dormibacteraeota bacterium]|nr:RDD family protein [Candidatus Dormibacteraeota bacterium]